MSVVETNSVLSHFPLPKARRSQEIVIQEIDSAFKSGKRIVILEAPVGSGKSAIAMTFARYFKNSHVITPRKSLQDQYYEDFKDDVVLMKGRGAYPCTYEATPSELKRVIKAIKQGRVAAPEIENSCAYAPCRNSPATYSRCVSDQGDCPYTVAIEVAQENETVIHNIHSFIFQTNFGGKFEKRPLMVIDEAHEIEGVLRDFITKKFTINQRIDPSDIPPCKTIEEWCDFFMSSRFVPDETASDRAKKQADDKYKSARDEYIEKVETIRASAEYYDKGITVKTKPIAPGHQIIGMAFEFVPHHVGNAATKYLLDFGDKIILMSGTIYDHEMYCRGIGINPKDTYFIRVPSAFPLSNRPIYLKPEYQVDTSFQNWSGNFPEMIRIIKKIMGIFHNVKGLIHAPSYDAAWEIARELGPRAFTHSRGDFQERLEAFYEAEDPLVFISPVCQQGVDFKGDRARFQIVTRVPYLNTSDEFMNYKVQNDFNWYNYQALIIFGQQVGRVNRSENDFGATFLLDQRFNKFVSRNSRKLPQWLQKAFVWR